LRITAQAVRVSDEVLFVIMFVIPLPSKCKKLKPTSRILSTEEISEGSFLEHQFSKPQILIDLGLTNVQARVYLALVKSGPSKITGISNISKVARPEIYRNLSKLQKLGLVERIIETPLKYRAVPINEGISLLLQTKTRQYEKVRSEAKILLSTVKMEKPKKKQIEPPQFVLIPKRTVIERIRTAIENAQLSIDLVLSWKRFSQGIAGVFAESIETAWAKNVKIRFIIESPPESKTEKQLIQFCREKPSTQVRFISHYPKATFGIYDKKEIYLIAKSKTGLPGSPALCSNNQRLTSAMEDYFEILWLTAMKEPSQSPQA
jgi:sugar-specific transcriptional regulator TrmB